MYRTKVKAIICQSSPSARVKAHISTYTSLFASRHLLPQLRTLIIPEFDDNSVEVTLLHLFLSSDIRHILITSISDSHLFNSFCWHLWGQPSSGRHLQSLTLNHYIEQDMLCRLARASRSLRYLKIATSLNEPTLSQILTSLPLLQELDICIGNDFVIGSSLRSQSISPLSVQGTFTALYRFMQTFSSPSLRSLRLTLLQDHTGNNSEDESPSTLFSVMATKWTPKLEDFEIDFTHRRHDAPADVLKWSDLRPFLPLLESRSLHSLHIINPPFWYKENLPVTTLARLLPQVRSLHLPPHRQGSGANFNDLYEIAKLCPSLKYLAISVCTVVNSDWKVAPLNHELETLHVYDLDFSAIPPGITYTETASWLDRIFPYLTTIETSPIINFNLILTNRDVCWKEVQSLLSLCHQARNRAW
ncbi:hypothetical protein BDN72DRAFT_835120 [Pluteus cervinus]|uniref:Uncharacterized protein n=1 Tax=Pluteus cervinus TaxID=181527 RepID=A0ACD3B5N3_9AGAR|nr:hypothetical protein BDN72DRAFT_835120 [Pluteus cervinus]